MTADSKKIWRCPSCNRLLVEKTVDYAKARHAEMLARTRGASLEFVREATWPAYLASLRRCRCGSARVHRGYCAPGLVGRAGGGAQATVAGGGAALALSVRSGGHAQVSVSVRWGGSKN